MTITIKTPEKKMFNMFLKKCFLFIYVKISLWLLCSNWKNQAWNAVKATSASQGENTTKVLQYSFNSTMMDYNS